MFAFIHQKMNSSRWKSSVLLVLLVVSLCPATDFTLSHHTFFVYFYFERKLYSINMRGALSAHSTTIKTTSKVNFILQSFWELFLIHFSTSFLFAAKLFVILTIRIRTFASGHWLNFAAFDWIMKEIFLLWKWNICWQKLSLVIFHWKLNSRTICIQATTILSCVSRSLSWGSRTCPMSCMISIWMICDGDMMITVQRIPSRFNGRHQHLFSYWMNSWINEKIAPKRLRNYLRGKWTKNNLFSSTSWEIAGFRVDWKKEMRNRRESYFWFSECGIPSSSVNALATTQRRVPSSSPPFGRINSNFSTSKSFSIVDFTYIHNSTHCHHLIEKL